MKVLTKTLLSATILAFGTLASTALAQTVRIGTEGAYPPYNLINDDGEVDGFERELGDALCEIAKLDCTWVTNEWDSIIPNLVSSNYDAIMAGMSITEERDQVIDFSESYFPADPSAYVALSGADAMALTKVVAAQVSTIQSSHVASSGASLQEFSSPDETIAAVRNGEADAVLADKAFLEPIVNESNGELVFVGEDVILGDGIGVGLRESDQKLRKKFNKAIKKLKADGRLNAMIKKWFGAEAAVF